MLGISVILSCAVFVYLCFCEFVFVYLCICRLFTELCHLGPFFGSFFKGNIEKMKVMGPFFIFPIFPLKNEPKKRTTPL